MTLKYLTNRKGALLHVLLFLLLLAFSLHPASAQFTSNVQGSVTDPAGAVISGAEVTLTNTDTNIKAKFTTGASGQYTFSALPPGPYAIEVVAAGFEKRVSKVVLTTQQTTGMNVQMQVGTATATIDVTAESGHELNPDETRIQYTLSSKEIAEFPLQNQSTLSLLRTTPGATGINENHQNVAINRDTASESVGGRGVNGNIFVLDQIPIVSELGNTSGNGGLSTGYTNLIPHPDMVQEIALQTTNFAVDNGASSGIQISYTTKSGANKFHGDADYSYAAGDWATNFNGSGNGAPKPSSRKQYVSGALGGPIWKDRTFFFGSYFNQQVQSSNGGTAGYFDPAFINWALDNYPNSQNISRGLVPYPADRAVPGTAKNLVRGGDLSGMNFITFQSVDCGTAATAPNLIPVPCDLPIWSQAYYNAPFFQNGAQYNFRLDHSMREGKDRLYASFFRFDQTSASDKIQSTLGGITPSTGWYLAGNYTHTFTPTLLNEASFGQTRFFFNYGVAPGAESQLMLPYLSGCMCVGLNQIQFLEKLLEHQTYGRDSVSWIKGKHSFTFGFQGAYNNELQDMSQVYGRPFLMGSFFYLDYVNDLSDLELIYTLSANTNNHPGKYIPQLFGSGAVRFGLYAQDAWKVTPNLVLNYGIRWDSFGNPSGYGENTEQYSNVNLGPGSLLQKQVAGLSVGLVNNVYTSAPNKNFLPRGGFAYTLPKWGGNTVVHGGIGLYEDDLNLNDVSANLPTQPPVRLSLTLGQFSNPKALTSYGTTTVQGAPGGNPYGFQFPDYPIYGYAPSGAPVDASGNVQIGDLFGVNPTLKPQRSFIYNLGFEQQFPKRLVFGMLYLGSYSDRQLVTTDVNTYPGAYASGSAQNLYNPDFGKIKFFRNAGDANYNAMIVTARQTIGSLNYQASYTWGKSLGDPTNSWTDQYDMASQYTYSNGDTRSRFSFLEVYEVPTHFENSVMKKILANWNISSTIVGQTGQPFTVNSTSGAYDFNHDGTYYDIPSYVGNKRSFSRSDAHNAYFTQTSIFGNVAGEGNGKPMFITPPGVNQEGDRQNNFFGPGYFDMDMGVSKKIDIPWFYEQRASLALRGQFINLLNHANYNNPSGTNYDSLPTVGIVNGTHQGRIIQIGARLQF